MEILLAILSALAIHVGIPAIIGFAIVGSIIQAEKAKLLTRVLVCATDADCPPGYICAGGRCVPQQAR